MFYEEKSDCLSYLPEFFQGIVEVNAAEETINIQMDKLLTRIRQGVEDKSIALTSAEGAARWEQILGVSTPLNSSLTARRDALRAKLISKPPINLQSLKTVIEAYMGVQVDIQKEEGFILKIWYRGESRQPDLIPLYSTIYEMIPANLLVEISYLFVVWDELDNLTMDFDQLDTKKLDWNTFERGEWIV